jgi:hypothetical protein
LSSVLLISGSFFVSLVYFVQVQVSVPTFDTNPVCIGCQEGCPAPLTDLHSSPVMDTLVIRTILRLASALSALGLISRPPVHFSCVWCISWFEQPFSADVIRVNLCPSVVNPSCPRLRKTLKLGKQKTEMGIGGLRKARGSSSLANTVGRAASGQVAPIQLALRRTDQGNRFALISAVNAEVLAIHRNDTR